MFEYMAQREVLKNDILWRGLDFLSDKLGSQKKIYVFFSKWGKIHVKFVFILFFL